MIKYIVSTNNLSGLYDRKLLPNWWYLFAHGQRIKVPALNIWNSLKVGNLKVYHCNSSPGTQKAYMDIELNLIAKQGRQLDKLSPNRWMNNFKRPHWLLGAWSKMLLIALFGYFRYMTILDRKADERNCRNINLVVWQIGPSLGCLVTPIKKILSRFFRSAGAIVAVQIRKIGRLGPLTDSIRVVPFLIWNKYNF